MGDRRRDVKHEVELEAPGRLWVEQMVLVSQADGGESVPQLAEFPARVGEAGIAPEDSAVALHQLLHLDPHAREALLPSLATHEAVEDASFLPPEGFSRRGAAGIRDPLLRVLGRGEAAPLAEHEALAQAVRPEAVRAVDRDARGLADRVQAGKRRLPGRVRGHPAHDVMLARTHGDRLVNRIETHVLLREFADHREFLLDRRGSEVTQVEAEVRPVGTLKRAARFDLLDHRSREDVPRPELHFGREVALHVSLPVLVDQIATLAAGRLRDQDARPREARRMELNHLHVLQRHAGAVGGGLAAARLDEAIRGEFDPAAEAAGREDRRLPVDRDEAPAPKVDGDHPRTDAAVDNQARHEVLVEPVDVLELHRRLEERVQDVEADLVRREDGPLHGHPAERTLAHPAVRVAGPGAAPVLELDDLLRAPRDEELDRVLVGEEVRSFDRVEGVQLEGVVVPQDRRGDAFRGHGVAPHRVDFRHDRDRQVRVRLRRRDRRAQPRRAPADDHDIVRGPVHEPRNRVGRISFWHIRFAMRHRAVSLRTRGVSPAGWQLSRRPAQKSQVARARWSLAMEVVRVEGLGKTYPGGTKALEDVSFSIQKGEIFCLLGPNGAGKATLLRILATQLKPTVGRASVLGHDVLAEPQAIRPHIAVVPQEARPQMLLSPYDHILYFCLIRGQSRAQARERTRKVMEDLGLWEHRDKLASDLSGGLRQRLIIAMAMVADPEVLFLDEPTIRLDPLGRRSVWHMLRELTRKGATILLTTHYLDEAEILADHLLIVDKGRTAFLGTVEEAKGDTGLAMRVIVEPAAGNASASPEVLEPRSAEEILAIVERGLRAKRKITFKPASLEDAFIKIVGGSIEVENT